MTFRTDVMDAALPAAPLPVPASEPPPERRIEGEPSLRRTVVTGLTMIGLFFGGFLGWSLFADLDSAVVADGTVVVAGHRKTVQHLEGGILREILVKEGDTVHGGQVLAYLDSTQADSAVGQLQTQSIAVKARLARLRAEQAGKRTIVFPDDLMARRDDPVAAETMTSQRQLFQARLRAHESRLAVLRRRIEQHREEIAANTAQLRTNARQQSLTQKELDNVQRLYSRGYERLPRLLALQRAVAELQGKESELRGAIGKAKQGIAAAQMEISSARDTRLAEITHELQIALGLESELADKLNAARDVRERRAILAPLDGTVVDLKVFTVGGVIAPGQPLLDIVPREDSLVIEAKIRPADIETVRVGMPARVLLTAYKRTEVSPIDGRVINVSADKLTDSRTGEPYFVSRVSVNPVSLAALKSVTLQAGMPAEVMLTVGERRAIDYFLEPLTERMQRAFREK